MLSKTLELNQYHNMAVVGAGGKSTLINYLTWELSRQGQSVVVTTTTKMFVPGFKQQQLYLWPEKSAIALPPIRKMLPNIIGSQVDAQGKLHALSKAKVDALAAGYVETIILNEADGAAGKPFKAPRLGEPVIPESTDLVCCVLGLEALDQPLTTATVHRVAEVESITGCRVGERVTVEMLARVYSVPQGYAPQRFSGRATVLLINQVDTQEKLGRAQRLAQLVQDVGFSLILAVSLRKGRSKVLFRA